MELAMNLGPGNPERRRLESLGWQVVEPHEVASSPAAYRRYLRGALAEFTVIKGVDSLWRTGWVSDRAAAFLATGRPVITEDAAVGRYLPAGERIHGNPHSGRSARCHRANAAGLAGAFAAGAGVRGGVFRGDENVAADAGVNPEAGSLKTATHSNFVWMFRAPPRPYEMLCVARLIVVGTMLSCTFRLPPFFRGPLRPESCAPTELHAESVHCRP